EEQQTYATTTAQGYRDAEYDIWTYGDPNSSIHSFQLSSSFASGGWSNPLAIDARNYIDSPTAANHAALMSRLSSSLGNPNLVVSDVGNVDLVADSTSDLLTIIHHFNSDLGTPYLRLGGSYRTSGESFWTVDGLYWAGWAGIFWTYTETYAENNIYFQGNVQVHDLAAQNNAELYEGYRD
ncbi:hypothetical protein DLM76_21425, partial [Leptospira yasudae]|uniref:hypothetical protein n=1 Tax=Leptospira yasudae TaxID=2202201 RepID=UPI000EC7840F